MSIVININTVAKLAEKNPAIKGVFTWTVKFILHLLESQRLIDFRKIEAASLDWERGTLDLGNNFTEQLFARAVSEYVVNRKLKKLDFVTNTNIRSSHEANKR